MTLLEKGEDESAVSLRWGITTGGDSIESVYEEALHSHVVTFDTAG